MNSLERCPDCNSVAGPARTLACRGPKFQTQVPCALCPKTAEKGCGWKRALSRVGHEATAAASGDTGSKGCFCPAPPTF